MPWIPKRDALRQFREARGYSIYELAHRVGISERQIRTIESEAPPGSIFNNTIASLAKALGCTKEDLATWAARKLGRSEITSVPERDADTPRSLEELAAMERESRLSGEPAWEHIATPYGAFELLGAERALEIQSQYGAFEGQRFVIFGAVEGHAPLPNDECGKLGIEVGIGGGFRVSRALFYEVGFGVTVLTTTPEMTRYLIDLNRIREVTALVARVVVARPKDDWKGFTGLDSRAPVPFAFVAEAAFDLPDSNEASA